jgi:hypothetical protein
MLQNALNCFLDWKKNALNDVMLGPDSKGEYWHWTSQGKIFYAFRWYCRDENNIGKWFYKLPLVTPSDFRLDGKCVCYSCDEMGQCRYSIYKQTNQSKIFKTITQTSKSLLEQVNWLRSSQHQLDEVVEEQTKMDMTSDAVMIYSNGLDICWEYTLDCIDAIDE